MGSKYLPRKDDKVSLEEEEEALRRSCSSLRPPTLKHVQVENVLPDSSMLNCSRDRVS